jgi:rare lipoprotein A
MSNFRPLFLSVTGMACFASSLACASQATPNTCRLSGPMPENAETASWYGKKHHGRKTANGEHFNKNDMTAAHPTLPLGSFLKVTNLANGRAVHVRVTDREAGYTSDIDLSEAAANALGMRSCGVAWVLVSTENPPEKPPPKLKTAR